MIFLNNKNNDPGVQWFEFGRREGRRKEGRKASFINRTDWFLNKNKEFWMKFWKSLKMEDNSVASWFYFYSFIHHAPSF